jgi:hypothetical protein
MSQANTQEVFERHLKSQFRLRVDGEKVLELELDAVTPFPSISHARGDMERFSLYFRGSGDFFLPQSTYRLEHDDLGELEIFLVPVERDAKGFRYEAVFSYFK